MLQTSISSMTTVKKKPLEEDFPFLTLSIMLYCIVMFIDVLQHLYK